MALCRKFDMDAEEFIKSGATIEEVKDKALEMKFKAEKPITVTVGEDDRKNS